MKRLVLAVCLILALSVSARADINFIGGGGGGGGSTTTVTTGTWTPGLAGSTAAGSATYTNQIGSFIETSVSGGQTWVTVTYFVTTSAFSGGTGNLLITGLPVTPTLTGQFFSGNIANMNGITLTANFTIAGVQASQGATSLSVIQSGSAQSAAFVPVGNAAAATQIIGEATYRVS